MTKRLLEEFNPSVHVEMLLLNAVRHEIMNFRPGFSAKGLKSTFFLSEAGSDWLTFEYEHDKCFLTVPWELMKCLAFMDMINLSLVKKPAKGEGEGVFDDAFYLVFKIGSRDLKQFGALRIRCSKKRAKLLSNQKEVHLIAVDDKGEAFGLDDGKTYFTLRVMLEEVANLRQTSWEKD